MEKVRTHNNSIDIFRILCAIMVIAIHTHPFEDINPSIGYIFTQILPRIGVPFFFAVSGYYCIPRMIDEPSQMWKYLKRILRIYILWSVIYFIVDFLLLIRDGNFSAASYLKSCIVGFFVTGSYYHFWYFPALIFSVCFTALLLKCNMRKIIIPGSIALYIIGCLGCSYFKFGTMIPLLNKLYLSPHFTLIRRIFFMAFPFFVLGYCVYVIKDHNRNFLKFSPVILLISILAWLLEIILVHKYNLQKSIVITPGLYILLSATLLMLIRYPLPKAKGFSSWCHTAANFMYYSHPLCILIISILVGHFFQTSIKNTPLFFSTILLSGIMGTIIYFSHSKFLNKFI